MPRPKRRLTPSQAVISLARSPADGALASSLKPGCVKGLLDKPASHDNLFHTTMGWVGARADVYKPEWDLLAGCRR